MKQEDKDLFIKDICARIPYGVVGKCELDASYDTSFDTIFQTHKFDAVISGFKADSLFVYPLIEDRDEQEFANEEVANGIDILDFKPYLLPMSSMTEAEKEEYCQLQQRVIYNSKGVVNEDITKYINWCYKKHLDINNLIPMGLAIDATGLNILNYDRERKSKEIVW